MKKLTPKEDRVIVIPIEEGKKEHKTKGGLIVPDAVIKSDIETGTVYSIGPDCKTTKEGDTVMYLNNSGRILDIGGEEHIIMRETDILI